MDKARTFCSAHTRAELRAWGFDLGPPFPGSVLRGDVPTRAELERRDAAAIAARIAEHVDPTTDPRRVAAVLERAHDLEDAGVARELLDEDPRQIRMFGGDE
jgi:hypothetical protein